MIRGKMIFAESATSHPDGTFSLLKGGINRITGAQPPFPFNASMVMQMDSDMAEAGDHRFEVRCVDEDGGAVVQPLQASFSVPKGGGVTSVIAGMSLGFPKAGRFVFYLRIDNAEHDSWAITVVQAEKQEDEENE